MTGTKNKIEKDFARELEIALPGPGVLTGNSGRLKASAREGRRSLISSGDGLTRNERREVKRRKHILDKFATLKAAGLSVAEAARQARVSLTTLWRWKKRLSPVTHLCGRKTDLERLDIPQFILSEVRRLQLGGKGNAAAWLAIADHPRCPQKLSDYLKKCSTGNVARSLLAATRLTRRTVQILQAPGFVLTVLKTNEP